MRLCNIKNCGTNSSNKERCLFEIKGEDRQKWIPITAAYQRSQNAKSIYICDLHFDPNDLDKNGKTLRPKKNVLPRMENISNSSQVVEIDDDQPILSTIPENLNCSSDTIIEMKTISVNEYRKLIQSTIDLVKANQTIDKLNMMIQRKNALIDDLEIRLRKRTENSHLSEEQNEVLNHLQHRRTTNHTKYSPVVRKFCLRIQFHSTCAYNELRKFFGNNLPTCRTIQRWLRTVDATPGITDLALEIIEEKAKSYKDQGKQLHLCLVSDEMSIRKQITWGRENGKFFGFVTKFNTQNNEDNNVLAVAKDALVFMAVGPDFRIAVAYFLLNGLQSIDRAVLTREVLRNIHRTGAKIISLTSDGLRANIVVAGLLGADFKNDKPYFPNPCNQEDKIYVILDPGHMLKLLRKYFAEQQLYYNNDPLQWNLLQILSEKQDSDNFELANKLSCRHINYKIAPMEVRLAVQTFSNSVADVLEQLDEDKYENFVGCGSTVSFIRLINKLFDVMNYTDGKKSDNHFKRPICESTLDSIQHLFKEAKQFIEQMFIEYPDAKKNRKMVPVLQSRSSMGFFGFLHNMTSTLGIYNDYVKNGSLETFNTFQYSQDHLETYFSLIRASLGANNNPNEQQFSAAYRRLLFCVPQLSARGTNCNLNVGNVLTVSSAEHQTLPTPGDLSSDNEIEIRMSYDELLKMPLDSYEQHMCAYLSSCIETNITKNIETRNISACQDCLKIFEENPKICDRFIARKHMNQPCASTRDLIMICDSIFKFLQTNEHIGFQSMLKTIFNKLNINRLYELSYFDNHDRAEINRLDNLNMTHKEQFILAMVKEYMHMKSNKIGKRITIQEQGPSIRKKASRNIIVAGQ